MGQIGSVTTNECDLCGAVWATEGWVDRQLPDGTLSRYMDLATTIVGGDSPAFCPECVVYVRAARDRAVEERRDIHREPPSVARSLAERALARLRGQA